MDNIVCAVVVTYNRLDYFVLCSDGLYVSVDHPVGVTQYGGTVAAPIAKSILESAIEVFDLKPSKEVMPKKYTWMDIKYIKVPNVVGKTKDEAMILYIQ